MARYDPDGAPAGYTRPLPAGIEDPLRIRDNGRGGADFTHGTGLLGLKDRAEALGGHLQLHSPTEGGTTLDINLPLDNPGEPRAAIRCQRAGARPA